MTTNVRRERRKLTGCVEPCRECGKQIGQSSYGNGIGDRIKKWRVCFNCDFWLDKLGDMHMQARHKWDMRAVQDSWPEGNFLFVIKGWVYSVNMADRRSHPTGARGFGGREGRFLLFDEKIVVASRNVWCAGKVPEHFRDRFPDTACWETGYDLTPVTMGG